MIWIGMTVRLKEYDSIPFSIVIKLAIMNVRGKYGGKYGAPCPTLP
jgi:hypothetical protein